MAHYEKMIAHTDVFQGRILHVGLDTVELEDGSLSKREIVRHPGGAAVLPIDETGLVYLVRQFRYAYGRELLEIPAGKLEPGEDPKAAALRELEEECGISAGQVTELGCIYPSVGYTDEVIHIYLARELRVSDARPDQGEFVTIERRPLKELLSMARCGNLRDAKTVTAVLKTAMLMELS